METHEYEIQSDSEIVSEISSLTTRKLQQQNGTDKSDITIEESINFDPSLTIYAEPPSGYISEKAIGVFVYCRYFYLKLYYFTRYLIY